MNEDKKAATYLDIHNVNIRAAIGNVGEFLLHARIHEEGRCLTVGSRELCAI